MKSAKKNDPSVRQTMILLHLVGNDPILSEILRQYRMDIGENIIEASLTGSKALSRISQRPGDVVIMTYPLPDMDASQFISRLRKINHTIPCIIFTEEGQEDLLLPAGSGMVLLLQKKGDLQDQCTAVWDLITRVMGDRRDELTQVQNKRLLSALAECTQVLLQEKEVDHALQKVLDIIGSATDQDRVYIFQAHPDPVTHEFLVSQRFEWTREGIKPQINNPDLQNLSFQVVAPYSYRLLRKGKIVAGLIRDHPESEREILSAQGIISILLVPIIIQKKLWGFIGFDNCTTEYEWKKGEKETLLTLANTIGTAISRALVEEDLRKTNEYLENLITHANGPIIVWDPDLAVTRVNKAFESLTGYSAQNVIGRHISEIFSPDDQHRWKELLQHIMNGERWEMEEIPVLHQDGCPRSVLWNSSTIFGEDGLTPVATIAQGLDITEKLRMEKDIEAAIRQIQVNFAQQSVLNDGIRNPLSVITGYTECIPDDQIREMIFHQVRLIDDMVTQLDRRWNESDKILHYLQKHHNVILEGNISASAFPAALNRATVRKIGALENPSKADIILDAADILVTVIDLKTYEILYCNQQVKTIFGECVGQKCYMVLQKDQISPCPDCTNQQLTDSSRPLGIHVWERYFEKNGRWYICHARVIPWTDGRLVRLEIATDITGRKHAEDLLLRNEERYRQISTLTSDFAFSCVSHNKSGFFIDWMVGAVEPICGYTIDELKEMGCWRAIVVTEDLPVFDRNITGLSPGQSATCELRILHKNGAIHWLSCKVRCEQERYHPDTLRLYGGCQDITIMREIQEALQEREERYRSLSSMMRMMCDTVPDMIWAKDLKKRYIFANKAICNKLLNARDTLEPVGKTDLYFAERERRSHPDNPDWHTFGDICRDTDQITMDAGEPRQFDEYGNVKGSFLFLDVHKAPFLNEKGEMIGTVGSARDVTAQKQAECALRESEERYRAIIAAIPDILFTLDQNGVYLTCHVNDPALLYVPLEYLIGKSLHEVLPAPIADQGLAAIQTTLRTGQMQFFEYSLDMRDNICWFEVRIIRSAPHEVLAIVRDITDQRYDKEALRQSNLKLRLLTSLTRHDIYNQISTMDMFYDLASRSDDPRQIREYIEKAKSAAGQIERIISFTREYESFGVYSTGWQVLYPILESAYQEVFPSDITFHTDIPKHLEIFTDPIIRKVFTTLLENSVRHGETVTDISLQIIEHNGDLILVYQDNGTGIQTAEKEMIFEHGFGKHTGIGLFLAREILSITGLSIHECGIYGQGVRFEIGVPSGKWRYGDLT